LASLRNNPNDLVLWQLLAFTALLLVLRVAGIYNLYFFEEDEVSIAAGVSALVRDNVGDLYRYSPQLGYYRLIEFLDLLFGGNVRLVPAIMKVWSALMGVVVPVAALFAFRAELTSRLRWLAALVLAVNPILWKSSQYGNSAMAALGIVSVALVILSNRPRQLLEILALVLFIAAVLVRADSVLLLPLVYLLLYRNHLSFRMATQRLVLLGFALLAVYGTLILLDPRLDDAVSAVSRHFAINRKTMFWEYMIWAMSPMPLVFAILGLSHLLNRRPFLLFALLLWLLAPMAMYFTATTTPRYFLLTVMPMALATAVGMADLAERLGQRIKLGFAWTAVIIAAFMHLLVGMGQFRSSWKASPFYGPTIRTDDGRMPTGALLYDTYLRYGFLGQSLRNPGFGQLPAPHWEGLVFTKALQVMGSDARAGHTTVLLLDTGYGHAFHYHAQVAGARYLSREPTDPSIPFSSETWLELGKSRIMTVAINGYHYTELEHFAVVAGDQIWVMGETPFPDQTALDKMPHGLILAPGNSFDEKIRVFEVLEREK
jgi:hypothetical protein